MTRRDRHARLLGFLVVWMLAGAWTSPAAAPTFHIMIDSGSPYYDPAAATVAAGTPIQWDNPTPSHHTVTHDGCRNEEGPCLFDSGSVPPNGTFTLPGLPPGHYPYQCTLHPIMRGLLIVTEPEHSSRT